MEANCRLRICSLCAVLTAAFVFAGCATQKIDWATRVGNYTFDQAVLDFGPPDKQARLTDGTTLAEWLARRGQHHVHGSPIYHPYWYGPYLPTYIESDTPDRFLRLTFDPNGQLKAWKRYYR